MSKEFEIFYLDCNNLKKIGKGLKLFVIDSDNLENLDSDNIIIIFKNKANIKNIKYISNNSIAIINTNNIKNIEILCNLHLKVITCGFSQKDTITFSSNSLDNCVISVQRTIFTIDKKRIDPLEIPIEVYDEIDSYYVLAYISLLILLGEIDNKIKIDLSNNSL